MVSISQVLTDIDIDRVVIKDSLSTTLHVSLHTFVCICYCLLEEIGLLICIKGGSKYFGYTVIHV